MSIKTILKAPQEVKILKDKYNKAIARISDLESEIALLEKNIVYLESRSKEAENIKNALFTLRNMAVSIEIIDNHFTLSFIPHPNNGFVTEKRTVIIKNLAASGTGNARGSMVQIASYFADPIGWLENVNRYMTQFDAILAKMVEAENINRLLVESQIK